MRKTFEDLIFDKEGQSDGWQTTYTFSTILELMTEVREATIKECVKNATFKGSWGIMECNTDEIDARDENGDWIDLKINREDLLSLDKNSIEIL